MQPPMLCGTVTVGERGQVVIPADTRQKLNIKTGEKLLVFMKPECDIIFLTKADGFESLFKSMTDHLSRLRTQINKAKKGLKEKHD